MGQNGPAPPEQLPLRHANNPAMDFSQLSTNSNLPSRGRIGGVLNFSGDNVSYGDSLATAMDLSPDTATGEQQASRGTSDHPTPSTSSNKGSSHTSFTPPQFDDGGNANQASSNSMSAHTAGDSFFQNPGSYNQFAPGFSPGFTGASKEGPEGMPSSFSFPASWDYSADGPANTGTGMKDHNPTGMTPGATGITSGATGMTPGATGMTPIAMPDGTWQINALEGNEWMFADWNGASPQT